MGQAGQVGQVVAPSQSPPQGERMAAPRNRMNRMNQMNRLWGGSMSKSSFLGKSNSLLYIRATLKCLSFFEIVGRSDYEWIGITMNYYE